MLLVELLDIEDILTVVCVCMFAALTNRCLVLAAAVWCYRQCVGSAILVAPAIVIGVSVVSSRRLYRQCVGSTILVCIAVCCPCALTLKQLFDGLSQLMMLVLLMTMRPLMPMLSMMVSLSASLLFCLLGVRRRVVLRIFV